MKHDEQPAPYEAPAVEQEISGDELEREVHYAGKVSADVEAQ